MLSVVCCFVSGEPVRRPARQAAEGCSVQQQQDRADRRLRMAICGLLGGALAVVAVAVAGAMAEILGAGGRSSRWCRAGWPGCSLVHEWTTTRDGYDAACNEQQRNVYGSEQLWNNGARTDVQNRSLRSRVPNISAAQSSEHRAPRTVLGHVGTRKSEA